MGRGCIIGRMGVLVLAGLLVALPIWAAKGDLLMLLPGFPGTTAQAQPYVDKMVHALEQSLGGEAGSMKGVFIPDGAKALSKLDEVTPDIALLGPSVYAAAVKTHKMTVVAQVYVNGRGAQTYFVVTKKNGITKLADLVGKTMSGQVAHDGKFVANVLLDGQLKPDQLHLLTQKRPMRSLRDVVNGKVDAALIDESVKAHLDETDLGTQIQVIYTAKKVPAPAVVAMNQSPKEVKRIKGALTGLCKGAKGKALCASLTITDIKPASNRDYKKLLAAYNRK